MKKSIGITVLVVASIMVFSVIVYARSQASIVENTVPFEQTCNTVTEATTQVITTSAATEPETQGYEACDEMMYISADEVNIRKGDSTSSEIITKLSKGIKVQRTGKTDTWSQIILSDGTKAYVATQFLTANEPQTEAESENAGEITDGTKISLQSSWKYAEYSKINSGTATLYKATSNNNNIIVCVNAGHGTEGGGSVKTQCHPDGTPKVTGGTTGAGATSAIAVSGGMTFADGTPEAKVTKNMAQELKNELLSRGYDVLMIRDGDDVQLDNIARTVIANNNANCHIALHWDSTSSNKGAFFMSVPDDGGYKNMEPVASCWQKHEALGSNLIEGLRSNGVKIWSGGSMDMDLTQTSYSTIPSVDIELGDKSSDHSTETLKKLAKGLADGIDSYFGR